MRNGLLTVSTNLMTRRPPRTMIIEQKESHQKEVVINKCVTAGVPLNRYRLFCSSLDKMNRRRL